MRAAVGHMRFLRGGSGPWSRSHGVAVPSSLQSRFLSSGDTRFAPIASATGELECSGFWDHGRADKDGLWTCNAPKAPTLVEWVTRVGANFGRCRVIELQPRHSVCHPGSDPRYALVTSFESGAALDRWMATQRP